MVREASREAGWMFDRARLTMMAACTDAPEPENLSDLIALVTGQAL